MRNFDEREESRLVLIVKRRSEGMGIPETMYLKTRAWCSSSCHCVAVKGNLLLTLLLISRERERGERGGVLR